MDRKRLSLTCFLDRTLLNLEVRSISINQVNFLKRLKYPDNDFFRSLLGALGQEPFQEIQVREIEQPGQVEINHWTFYVPVGEIEPYGLRSGMQVYGFLRAHVIPLDEETAVWVADSIDWGLFRLWAERNRLQPREF